MSGTRGLMVKPQQQVLLGWQHSTGELHFCNLILENGPEHIPEEFIESTNKRQWFHADEDFSEVKGKMINLLNREVTHG